MIVHDMVNAMMQALKENVERFCGEPADGPLTPESAAKVTEGLKHALAACGQEGFRCFLESKEVQQDVVVWDGEVFRFKMVSPKTLLTPFGKVEVRRRLYQNAKDSKTFVPLDAAWHMADAYMTVEVREAVAYACALMTPQEAHALLDKCAAFLPHPTQMKQCLRRIGEKVNARRDFIEAAMRGSELAPEGTKVLVASMDGVNVLLNQPGVKKGRPAERPKGSRPVVSPTSYKNAMVGSVSFYGEVPEGEKTPERLASRYIAHMPEDGAATFKGRFEAELAAGEAQVPDAIKVLLCDGARGIWNYAANTAMYADYEWLVDYWHAVEHLSKASEALFGKDSQEGAMWFKRHKGKLLDKDDGAQGVLSSMAYHAKTRRLARSAREALARERTFFLRNKDKMRYAEFRSRGLPIGSGPVEAACKSIVKQRLCRSGMRWSIGGGQHILDLRTPIKSGRWDTFWKTLNELPQAE